MPLTARKKMQTEFLALALEQGSMTVDSYEAQFTALSRYDPESVRDEAHKTERFLMGLRSTIRDGLLLCEMTSYEDIIGKA